VFSTFFGFPKGTVSWHRCLRTERDFSMSAILQLNRESGAGTDLLSAAFAAAPECMAIVEKGVIVNANPAFAQLFGYGAQATLVGQAFSEFVPGNRACSRQSNGTHGQPKIECGYPSCAFQTQKKGGTRIHVEARCAPYSFNGRELLVVSLQDITHIERRRVIRESDKRFRAVVDQAAIGIMQCSTDGRVLESNPAAQGILGYGNDELRGMFFHNFIHTEDLDSGNSLFQELLVDATESCQKELRFKRKDQAQGWARLTVSLVRGPDSEPEFVILMFEDVTEYKRAEQQIRESQRMEAIGRLVGGVAHDFNNLLTGIMLYSDLLKAGLSTESRLTAYIDEIRLASEHGGAMIQQLLSVAKRQVVEPRLLSLNEIVSGMQNLIARLIGEHIEFKTELDSQLLPVKMDPTQLQQILLNLAINARDAMPDGGQIAVATRNVPSRSAEAAATVELTVDDNGCGMGAETLAHVFEPFFTTKGADHGSGLGLTTVHNIVRESGGSIEISSEPGRGTNVTVRFPAAAPFSPRVESLKSGTSGDETILLVEDNESVRRSAKRILRQSGYRVLEAPNGREALRIFQQQGGKIQLLLTDLVLPGSDGREIAARIHEICPALPVIFTSGYQRAAPHPEVAEPVVVFRKPFAGEALVRKIRQVLDDGTVPANRPDQQKRKFQ
jgi:two-component system cell cycle sensor histidine kinase/response regulator CckA